MPWQSHPEPAALQPGPARLHPRPPFCTAQCRPCPPAWAQASQTAALPRLGWGGASSAGRRLDAAGGGPEGCRARSTLHLALKCKEQMLCGSAGCLSQSPARLRCNPNLRAAPSAVAFQLPGPTSTQHPPDAPCLPSTWLILQDAPPACAAGPPCNSPQLPAASAAMPCADGSYEKAASPVRFAGRRIALP